MHLAVNQTGGATFCHSSLSNFSVSCPAAAGQVTKAPLGAAVGNVWGPLPDSVLMQNPRAGIDTEKVSVGADPAQGYPRGKS